MGKQDTIPDGGLVLLQHSGLGEHRHLGCGIFIPHKDINKLHDLEKEKSS